MNIGLFLGAGASTIFQMPTTVTIMDDIRAEFSALSAQYILKTFPNEDLEVIYEELLKTQKLVPDIKQNPLMQNLHMKFKDHIIRLSDFTSFIDIFFKEINAVIHKQYYLNDDQVLEPSIATCKKLIDFCLDDTRDLDIFTTNYDNTISQFCNSYRNDYRFCDGFIPNNDSNDLIFDEKHLTAALENESKSIIRLFKLHGSVDWIREDKDGSKSIIKKYDVDTHQSLITPPALISKEPTDYPLNVLNDLFASKFSTYDLCIIIGTSFRDLHINKIIKQRIAEKKLTVLISPTILRDYAKNLLCKDSNNTEYLIEVTQNELQKTSTALEMTFDQQNIDELISRIKNFINLNKIENLDSRKN